MRGRLSMRKGKTFEQLVARILRKAWPGSVVHRSSQADRAYDPDLVIEEGPDKARWLWLELCHARHVDVAKKLKQGERDAGRRGGGMANTDPRYVVVVWRKSGERHINATMRVHVLDCVRDIHTARPAFEESLVTMRLEDFVGCVG